MATRLTDLQITYTKRNARARGPTSSEAWNDNADELVRDLNAISDQWNEFLVPLLQHVPDGTGDLDAFTNGLDGRTLLVNAVADEDSSYYNVGRARPYSIYEQFQAVYSYINSSISTVQQEVDAVSISAEDIPITDSVDMFSAITVEGALQEIMSLITLASDHGALDGLSDDDHTQYLPRTGSRAMTGALTGTTVSMTSNTSSVIAATATGSSNAAIFGSALARGVLGAGLSGGDALVGRGDTGVSLLTPDSRGLLAMSTVGYGAEIGSLTTAPGKAALRVIPQDTEPSGPNQVGDIYVTTAGVLKICTVAGSPGTWVSVGTQT